MSDGSTSHESFVGSPYPDEVGDYRAAVVNGKSIWFG